MTTYKRTTRDAKKAGREARIGDVLYVKLDVATNLTGGDENGYEDKHLVASYTVTHMHPLLGGAMISGALSVEGLVLREGPVYTKRPAGRGLHEPTPQVAGPLGKRPRRRFNAREIRELEREATQALARRHGKATAKQKVAAAKQDPQRLLELAGA